MSENSTTFDRQLNSEDSGISEKFVDSIRGLSPILRQNAINLALGKPQKRLGVA